MKFIPAKLAGRCCDGFEKGQGSKIHALVNARVEDHTFVYGDALCKAEPGRRSVGWTAMEGYDVTCPKCLKKVEQLGGAWRGSDMARAGSYKKQTGGAGNAKGLGR